MTGSEDQLKRASSLIKLHPEGTPAHPKIDSSTYGHGRTLTAHSLPHLVARLPERLVARQPLLVARDVRVARALLDILIALGSPRCKTLGSLQTHAPGKPVVSSTVRWGGRWCDREVNAIHTRSSLILLMPRCSHDREAF
jgi:hypothetical protein